MSTPRVRRDIQSLIDNDPQAIDAYGQAITIMRKRDPASGAPTDPLSWFYQAAIHGFPGVVPSVDDPRLFGACRHFSWYFLAWHRLYLFFFERIVQFHLQDDTWSLPYWDYTKTNDDSSRILPAPFRTPTTNNPLFTEKRDPDVNDETNPHPLPFDGATDARDALVLPFFTRDLVDPETTFGGGRVEDVNPNPGPGGSVENVPHGPVHVLVGGAQPPGLMFRFDTAGRDPIFWLHHANIDRLWDVWIGMHGAGALPQDDAWLDTEFQFFDIDGSQRATPVRDILVSADLGYEYESTAPPEGTPAVSRVTARAGRESMSEPEMVGAETGVDFGSRKRVPIDIGAAAKRRRDARAAEPERWILRVEDITGEEPRAPVYHVYLNLPEGESPEERPELRAGTVSAFGIAEATQGGGEHGTTGVTHAFDVTKVVDALRQDERWDEANVDVTIVPAGVKGEVEDGGDVRAGRISVYAG